MKIKRFFAKDIRSALAEVKEVLGHDAVIMSNKRVSGGVEIVAAVDFDAETVATSAENMTPNAPVPARDSFQETSPRALAEDRVSLASVPTAKRRKAPVEQDSLKALMEKQQVRRPNHAAGKAATKDNLPAWAQQAFSAKQSAQSKTNNRVGMHGAGGQSQSSMQGRRPGDVRKADQGQAESRKPRPGAAQVEMHAMKSEMASIRQLLEQQVSSLMHQDLARKDPVRALVKETLRDQGFHKGVADNFASMLPDDIEIHDALEHLPNLVSDALICGDESMLDHGGVIALVGPTGVGKTTTIAKLAARFAARYGINQVALVTTDNYRIGAQEQLVTFGKIMGCPVKSAANVEELEQVLFQLRSRRLVLIDTAGMGQRDMRLVEQLNQLTGSSRVPVQPYLVLAATAQYPVLKETVERFQQIDLSGCIFTKLDEAHNIGDALSVLIENELPICYLTDGQRVPEDLRTADAEFLAQRALSEVVVDTNPHQQVAGLYE